MYSAVSYTGYWAWQVAREGKATFPRAEKCPFGQSDALNFISDVRTSRNIQEN